MSTSANHGSDLFDVSLVANRRNCLRPHRLLVVLVRQGSMTLIRRIHAGVLSMSVIRKPVTIPGEQEVRSMI